MKVPSIHQINKICRGLQRHKFFQNHYASLALNINNVYMPRRPKPKQKKNLTRTLYWTIHSFSLFALDCLFLMMAVQKRNWCQWLKCSTWIHGMIFNMTNTSWIDSHKTCDNHMISKLFPNGRGLKWQNVVTEHGGVVGALPATSQ